MSGKKEDNKRVTLKQLSLKGELDTSILEGWVGGTKVTITAILNNTAVYYIHNGRTDRRFVETLELIEVNEKDVKILPAREPSPVMKAKTTKTPPTDTLSYSV